MAASTLSARAKPGHRLDALAGAVPPRALLGAILALAEANQSALALLERHAYGDWGELAPEDWQANEDALQEDTRLLSAYPLTTGERIWVITEWDRSATTVLLPAEY